MAASVTVSADIDSVDIPEILINLQKAIKTDVEALQGGTSVTGVNGTSVAGSQTASVGAVLRIAALDLAGNTAQWGAVNLADTDAVTGVLPGANVAAAVAGVSAGVVTAADQTHINSTPTIQEATVTLVAGTATINTVIVLGATSRIIPNPTGVITGSTNYAHCRELFASRINGIAGVASAVIEALGNDGAKDTDAAGAVHLVILTPHA